MATTTETSTAQEPTNSHGPFAGVRKLLWGLIVLLFGFATLQWGITGGNTTAFWLVGYLTAWILVIIGCLWFIDMIASYLKN